MRRITTLAISALFAVALVTGGHALSAQTSAPPPGDAKRGHDVFVAQGCYECHNYQGQGSGNRSPAARPAPAIAPAPIPYAAFVKQLRAPRSAMPVYDAHLINEQGIADIYAYLLAQPGAKTASTIPLLASVTTGAGSSGPPSAMAHGADVFAANCAACHGAQGQGGVGPALKNESARKDTAAVAAFVKNPSGAMPKLFPSVLSESDVAAVSAYVETLR